MGCPTEYYKILEPQNLEIGVRVSELNKSLWSQDLEAIKLPNVWSGGYNTHGRVSAAFSALKSCFHLKSKRLQKKKDKHWKQHSPIEHFTVLALPNASINRYCVFSNSDKHILRLWKCEVFGLELAFFLKEAACTFSGRWLWESPLLARFNISRLLSLEICGLTFWDCIKFVIRRLEVIVKCLVRLYHNTAQVQGARLGFFSARPNLSQL